MERGAIAARLHQQGTLEEEMYCMKDIELAVAEALRLRG